METRELVILNREGERMPSTLRIPAAAPKGTVVLLHGLGGLRDQKLLRLCAEALANDGYVTFAFDDSHAVRSLDARFFEATTTQNVHDTEDAIGHVRKEDWFAPPLILLGHSMGGFAAVHYAARHPGIAAKLILLAPAVSWRTMRASIPFALLWLLTGKQKVLALADERHAELGRAWMLDLLKYDANRDAPRADAPALIVSAEHDETVATPAEHRAFAKRFPHATHAVIRGADHDFGEQEDEVVATIRQWLTSS